jgi:hypothetical protein
MPQEQPSTMTGIEAARLMVYQAAWQTDHAGPPSLEHGSGQAGGRQAVPRNRFTPAVVDPLGKKKAALVGRAGKTS